MKSQTTSPQDIHPKKNSRHILSFNNTLKEKR
jgi:hypothetical protein